MGVSRLGVVRGSQLAGGVVQLCDAGQQITHRFLDCLAKLLVPGPKKLCELVTP